MNTGIYCIENIINKKKYVGKAEDIEDRWKEHRYLLNKKKHINKHLENSWYKYGMENFIFYIIEICESEKLSERERFYIFYFDAKNNGYNLTDGGQGILGYRHTEKSKLKMSINSKGKTKSEEHRKKISEVNKGKHLSEETKQKMSASTKGRVGKPLSEETKQKISKALTGKNNANYGVPRSEEVKEKISKANSGKKRTPEQNKANSERCKGRIPSNKGRKEDK